MKVADFQRLVEQVGQLTGEQRAALAKVLAGQGEAGETTALIEARFCGEATCPHCQGEGQKWGFAAGLRRYRCRACKKSFNALTLTPLGVPEEAREARSLRPGDGRGSVAAQGRQARRHRSDDRIRLAPPAAQDSREDQAGQAARRRRGRRDLFPGVRRRASASSTARRASAAARRLSAGCRTSRSR